jgi:hypothetical protein
MRAVVLVIQELQQVVVVTAKQPVLQTPAVVLVVLIRVPSAQAAQES